MIDRREPRDTPVGMTAHDAAQLALLAQALDWFTEVYADRDPRILHAHGAGTGCWLLVVKWEDGDTEERREFSNAAAFWDFMDTLTIGHRG